MVKALGIINIEPYYVKVEGVEEHRPISASSILGRYRVIDFILSYQKREHSYSLW